jgi:hypothetical protein
VDAVVLSADGGRIELAIAQSCEWDGSDPLFSLLQQKRHYSVGFAADGQLAKAFPDAARLPWCLILSCQTEPDDRTRAHLELITPRIRQHGGGIEVQRQRNLSTPMRHWTSGIS